MNSHVFQTILRQWWPSLLNSGFFLNLIVLQIQGPSFFDLKNGLAVFLCKAVKAVLGEVTSFQTKNGAYDHEEEVLLMNGSHLDFSLVEGSKTKAITTSYYGLLRSEVI